MSPWINSFMNRHLYGHIDLWTDRSMKNRTIVVNNGFINVCSHILSTNHCRYIIPWTNSTINTQLWQQTALWTDSSMKIRTVVVNNGFINVCSHIHSINSNNITAQKKTNSSSHQSTKFLLRAANTIFFFFNAHHYRVTSSSLTWQLNKMLFLCADTRAANSSSTN